MNQPLLVLDAHYLCHRALHSTPNLSYSATGVIFGFLKTIGLLKDQFQTDRIAFCFEHPKLYRRDIYPTYKHKRIKKEYTPEEKQSHVAFSIQISELRQRYLPKIGFKNILYVQGMESDDVMAAIARDCPVDDEVVLVTSDFDMLQCLRSNVSIYSPQKQKILTYDWFRAEYRIEPRQWALVKAIAGCAGDDVDGIAGVGEITALKYLRGELEDTSRAYLLIQDGKSIVRRNRRLVELPFEGCPTPKMVVDQVTKKSWLEVCDMLGMRSIASHPPIVTRKLRRCEIY